MVNKMMDKILDNIIDEMTGYMIDDMIDIMIDDAGLIIGFTNPDPSSRLPEIQLQQVSGSNPFW